jgi:hypothetical protein
LDIGWSQVETTATCTAFHLLPLGAKRNYRRGLNEEENFRVFRNRTKQTLPNIWQKQEERLWSYQLLNVNHKHGRCKNELEEE